MKYARINACFYLSLSVLAIIFEKSDFAFWACLTISQIWFAKTM